MLLRNLNPGSSRGNGAWKERVGKKKKHQQHHPSSFKGQVTNHATSPSLAFVREQPIPEPERFLQAGFSLLWLGPSWVRGTHLMGPVEIFYTPPVVP